MSTNAQIVGLVGTKGVGKTTIAQHLVLRGYTEISFADALKDSLSVLLGISRSVFDDPASKEKQLEGRLRGWSPRELMQKYGDMTKHVFGSEVFIDTLRRRLATIDTPVVISDIRFPAEATFARSLGAKVFRIVKQPNHEAVKNDSHESESLQHRIPCDHVIYNDGHSKKRLFAAVDADILAVISPLQNLCVQCGVNMGDCNPRQLCGKTYCENE